MSEAHGARARGVSEGTEGRTDRRRDGRTCVGLAEDGDLIDRRVRDGLMAIEAIRRTILLEHRTCRLVSLRLKLGSAAGQRWNK